MAVNFTANIGLAKPTESEVAENWVNNTELCEDNNLIIIDKSDFTLTSYTPALAAVTTPPSVGAGSIVGEYQDIQGFIVGSFIIQFIDPGVTLGSGEFGVSLPFVVDPVYHRVGTDLISGPGVMSCIGEGYIWDNSAVNTSGTLALDCVTVAGVSYVRMITETFAGKTSRVVRDSMPFALATLDKITGSFFYKKT